MCSLSKSFSFLDNNKWQKINIVMLNIEVPRWRLQIEILTCYCSFKMTMFKCCFSLPWKWNHEVVNGITWRKSGHHMLAVQSLFVNISSVLQVYDQKSSGTSRYWSPAWPVFKLLSRSNRRRPNNWCSSARWAFLFRFNQTISGSFDWWGNRINTCFKYG